LHVFTSRMHLHILKSKHLLTRLIILHEYYKNLHAGPQALLTAIRIAHFIREVT